MKKRNWKTIGIGIATIFIYFFVQLFAGDLLGLFGLDTSSINTHIKFLYLTVVDILILSSILLVNHKTIEHDFKDILKNHKKYFSKGINYWLISLIVMMASNLIIMLFFNNAIANNEDTIRTMLKINPIYVYFSAVFFAPVAKLIKDFHQRLSTLGQQILYLGRDLRILLSHNELIRFQFFEIATKGLIRNRSQIAFHFIETYRLKFHQAIQNNHLMLATDK